MGGAVAVCFEGCCGGMCWPGDRPGTHAAAGAAARGVRGVGPFHMLGSGRHEGGWFLFFLWGLLRCRRGILSHPRIGEVESAARGDHRSGHATPCHLRRDGTREVGFCFGGCSGVGGEFFHMLGSGHATPCRLRRDGTRGFWFGGFFHTLGSDCARDLGFLVLWGRCWVSLRDVRWHWRHSSRLMREIPDIFIPRSGMKIPE